MESEQLMKSKRVRSSSASSSTDDKNSSRIKLEESTKQIDPKNSTTAKKFDNKLTDENCSDDGSNPDRLDSNVEVDLSGLTDRGQDAEKVSDSIQGGSKIYKDQTTDVVGNVSKQSTSDLQNLVLTTPVVFSNGDWQAVYDSHSQSYYYANLRTGETTWTNPFESIDQIQQSSSSSTYHQSEHTLDTYQLEGIDPELAHLDPKTSRLLKDSRSTPSFVAKFNSRTGKFESDPSHDPSRVSEYNRARTQSRAYFDVEGWEKSLEKNNGKVLKSSDLSGRSEQRSSTKKLSKSELERFKEKKVEKKLQRKRAWLQ
ncbi:hypothetical protein BY996DRAFT_7145616 [Phakopsora pachyrhizi]|uniref:Expressed protein n=1 Tax=Phakopsora pachyrhizi TaxID=170000 RepID=A0AAV0BLR9_PHAPC|nr:hypothetical protein BY996DRAFT_7145616 [Phakopsora pachyrhizi]CAH7688192.1 expressed protein [Phakopsora pachyrhizi]